VPHVFGVLAAYLFLLVLLKLIVIDAQAPWVRGSHDWHLAQCVDVGAKLGAGLLMVLILHHYRLFGGQRFARRLGVGRSLLVAVVAVMIIMPVAYLQLRMGQVIWDWLEPSATPPIHAVLEALENSAWGGWGTVQVAIAAVIVAPLAEELFFRGVLLQSIASALHHAWLAILLSAVAFGLIHYGQPQDVLPLVTMGVILGYVRVRYGSLSACVLIHALFNARTIAFALLNPETVRSGV